MITTYRYSALSFWRRHFMPLEFCLAVVIGLAFAVWDAKLGGYHLVDATLKNNRSAIYGALAAICGSLLGFTITAVSIILGYANNERMAIVQKSKHYPKLWRVFVSAIRALGLATVFTLIGLVLDRDGSPDRLVLYLCVGVVALATLRLLRCLWAFENVIAIVTQPTAESAGDSVL